MAEILPFRALHYNPKVVARLDDVVTQPYDKITPEMQARYYERNPYNLVRLILRRHEPGEAGSVYSAAARDFHDWIERGILTTEPEPALYAYHQEYAVPGHPGVRRERRGFIGLCRLEEYADGVVHRHEQTLVGPKADRLELLKATRAHFGQIFMLYSDPDAQVEWELEPHRAEPPLARVEDEAGTIDTVWRVAEPKAIERVTAAMVDKKLVIADGHHRYETALGYRDLCRAMGEGDPRADFVMTTLVRMESPGLTILPTHRVVHGLANFDWDRFTADARGLFDVELWSLDPSDPLPPAFTGELARTDRERPAFGVYAGAGKAAVLRLRAGFNPRVALAGVAPDLARLDVVLLHQLLLERVLGISEQAVREQRHLRYSREAEEAVRQVERGEAQICVLMNPTPIKDVWENALAGRVLPQKSTDFYPKLLSGLTIYWLDNPAGI